MSFTLSVLYIVLSATVSSVAVSKPKLSLTISEENVSWYTAIQSGHGLVDKENIAKLGGWKSLAQYLPDGERLWIAAKASHTPFVSWEGCARWKEDSSCDYNLMQGGSIGDCTQYCDNNRHFLLLKGSECICVTKEKRDECFPQTTERCNEPCPNNPTDWCGGQTTSMTLYNTGPFDVNTSINGIRDDGMTCVLYRYSGNDNSSESRLRTTSCKFKSNYYICGANNNFTSVDNNSSVTWINALYLCSRSNRHLYYKETVISERVNPHWTSIRRGLVLNWTQIPDDSIPYCVSVGRDDTSRLFLYEDKCENKLKYIAIQKADEDMAVWSSEYFIVVVSSVIVVVMATKAGILYRGITLLRMRNSSENYEREMHSTQETVVDRARLSPPPSPVITQNKGHPNNGSRMAVGSSNRAGDVGQGTVSEGQTHVYHTFASAAAILDAKDQYVYSTVVPKANRKRVDYNDATIGRPSSTNSPDPLYDVEVARVTQSPAKQQPSGYENTLL